MDYWRLFDPLFSQNVTIQTGLIMIFVVPCFEHESHKPLFTPTTRSIFNE
jgi:hypothetical protein